MSVSRVIVFRLSAVIVGLCLLVLGSPSFAQGGAIPIQIGQNASGSLSADVSIAQFAVTATGGESATIQVLALSQGFAPRFIVLNPAGVEILSVANPNSQAILTGSMTFEDAGVYTIVITGENGSTGQFALSLQPGAAQPEPIPLIVNQPTSGVVGGQTPMQAYGFSTTAQGTLAVTVLSQTPGSGPLVTLYDESAGKTIASNDTGVIGAAYQLPAGERQYRIEIRAGESGNTAYSICLGTCGSGLLPGNISASPTPESALAIPTPTPQAAAATCTASSSAGGAANLRSGPGTTYAILGSLPLGQTAQVLGVWKGGAWYEVSINGQTLWVAGSVASLSGDCSALPLLATPTNVPLAPTQMPTVVQPSGGGNGTSPTATPTDTPERLLPDLTTTALQLFTDGADHWTFTVTILNNGKVAITPDETFAILACYSTLDNCNEYDDISESLQPGETTQFSGDIPFFAGAESRSVTVTLDGRSQIGESNESNNDAFTSIPG